MAVVGVKRGDLFYPFRYEPPLIMRYNLPGVPRRSILYEDYPGVDGYEGELILINLFEDGGYLVRRCRGSLWDESATVWMTRDFPVPP